MPGSFRLEHVPGGHGQTPAKDCHVRGSIYQSFDALLPGVDKPISIDSMHDATVFTRRWVIRDKDPALKALLRRLEKASSADTAKGALDALQQTLASHKLLSTRHGA